MPPPEPSYQGYEDPQPRTQLTGSIPVTVSQLLGGILEAGRVGRQIAVGHRALQLTQGVGAHGHLEP